MEDKTIIASRCPDCGAIIAEEITISEISSLEKQIKCKICGKNFMAVSLQPPKSELSEQMMIKLVVPCLVCAHSHPYTLSAEMLCKELFVLQCSYTGLDICFIGKESAVDSALRDSAKQLKEIFETQEKEEASQNFLDANIMQEVMYSVEELAITNRIVCNCGEPNLAIVIDYDKVHLSCKDCGCKKTLYASENHDIDTASQIRRLTLE